MQRAQKKPNVSKQEELPSAGVGFLTLCSRARLTGFLRVPATDCSERSTDAEMNSPSCHSNFLHLFPRFRHDQRSREHGDRDRASSFPL